LRALTVGLPPETLRIAAQTLEYIERNAQPVIHAGDAFLNSFGREDSPDPVMDTIPPEHLEDEKIEDLKEVTDIEDEEFEDPVDNVQVPEEQLYSRILPDKEKRKMDKVQAKQDNDAEKERKRQERELLKAEREKDKADRKMRAMATTGNVGVEFRSVENH